MTDDTFNGASYSTTSYPRTGGSESDYTRENRRLMAALSRSYLAPVGSIQHEMMAGHMSPEARAEKEREEDCQEQILESLLLMQKLDDEDSSLQDQMAAFVAEIAEMRVNLNRLGEQMAATRESLKMTGAALESMRIGYRQFEKDLAATRANFAQSTEPGAREAIGLFDKRQAIAAKSVTLALRLPGDPRNVESPHHIVSQDTDGARRGEYYVEDSTGRKHYLKDIDPQNAELYRRRIGDVERQRKDGEQLGNENLGNKAEWNHIACRWHAMVADNRHARTLDNAIQQGREFRNVIDRYDRKLKALDEEQRTLDAQIDDLYGQIGGHQDKIQKLQKRLGEIDEERQRLQDGMQRGMDRSQGLFDLVNYTAKGGKLDKTVPGHIREYLGLNASESGDPDAAMLGASCPRPPRRSPASSQPAFNAAAPSAPADTQAPDAQIAVLADPAKPAAAPLPARSVTVSVTTL